MEPSLVTSPSLARVLDQLIAREPIFHRPEFGTTRRDFEDMTDPDFWEVGATGRRYSRQCVIDTLVDRYSSPHEDVWEASGFHCLELVPGTYLLTSRWCRTVYALPAGPRFGGELLTTGRSFTTKELSSRRSEQESAIVTCE